MDAVPVIDDADELAAALLDVDVDARGGFDLARERLAARLDDDARADRQAIALARAFELDLHIVVLGLFAERVDPDLAAGDEVEIAVAVDVGERGLIRLRGGHAGLL